MVGVTGLEPAAPCSQSTCATKLRYTPAMEAVPHKQQKDYSMGPRPLSSPGAFNFGKTPSPRAFRGMREGREGFGTAEGEGEAEWNKSRL